MAEVLRTVRELGHASAMAAAYAQAAPFPHVVLEDVLEPDSFRSCVDEFKALDHIEWKNYLHVNERKYANQQVESWGPTLQRVAAELMSPPFIAWLEQLTGIEGLIADPTLDGGGLHRSLTGGFLNVHADFTAHHTQQTWQRRINLLLYLNDPWQPEWGGDLELWEPDMSRCVEKIAPIGNRVVIFTTTHDAFHGHPTPLATPQGVARRSLALYYFTETDAPLIKSTNYRGRPEDGWKKVLIRADAAALRGYDVAKRRLGLSDKWVSRTLGRLGRSKKDRRR